MSDRMEVGGIDVPFDKDKLTDMRFVLMLGDLDDETLDDGEKLPIMARLVRYLFGNERGRIMDELAEANGGTFEAPAFSKWFAEFMKAAGAKN